MLIIRYEAESTIRLAAINEEGSIFPIPYENFLELVVAAGIQNESPVTLVRRAIKNTQPLVGGLEELKLLTPIEAPEIWAAGVTYERSRDARNYETSKQEQTEKTFYDKVYDAVRPEIFLKSSPLRSVGPNEELTLRSDSVWQIPEPELGLVLNREGTILGYTIGNDMSCRDIEGENPLYLPQAKMWRRSCAIGPAIRLAETVEDPYDFEISLEIVRKNQIVVNGTVNTRQLKRKLEELVSFLIRDNDIYAGTILLTGTGIVPPNDFTLASGDRVDIRIAGIGLLSNPIQ
ncbi:MAG: fumarylacetoacetate hydrolase family protein [Paenibacillaceae bacterium]